MYLRVYLSGVLYPGVYLREYLSGVLYPGVYLPKVYLSGVLYPGFSPKVYLSGALYPGLYPRVYLSGVLFPVILRERGSCCAESPPFSLGREGPVAQSLPCSPEGREGPAAQSPPGSFGRKRENAAQRASLPSTRFTVGQCSYVPVSSLSDSYEAQTGAIPYGTTTLLLGVLFPLHCWISLFWSLFQPVLHLLARIHGFRRPCVTLWNGNNEQNQPKQ